MLFQTLQFRRRQRREHFVSLFIDRFFSCFITALHFCISFPKEMGGEGGRVLWRMEGGNSRQPKNNTFFKERKNGRTKGKNGPSSETPTSAIFFFIPPCGRETSLSKLMRNLAANKVFFFKLDALQKHRHYALNSLVTPPCAADWPLHRRVSTLHPHLLPFCMLRWCIGVVYSANQKCWYWALPPGLFNDAYA